jgi:hypothetical protein
MPEPIDYAASTVTNTKPRGLGYYFLILLNAIALLLTAWLLPYEISGGRNAALLGLAIGIPFVGIDVMVAGLPSWSYVGAWGEEMSKGAKLTLISISTVPTVLGVVGIVVSQVRV